MHNCAFAATHESLGGHEESLLPILLLADDYNALSFSFFLLNPLSSTLKNLVHMRRISTEFEASRLLLAL
jgi:hypothetical protein